MKPRRTWPLAFGLLTIACGGTPSSEPRVDVVHQLELVAPATVSLPSGSPPLELPEDWSPSLIERPGGRFEAELPFLDEGSQRYAPRGMKVYRGAVEVPYASFGGPGTWSIERGHLVVHPLQPLEDDPITVRWPGLSERLDRLDPVRSGLEPADFIRLTATHGPVTRSGVFLPSPTRLTWHLQLPDGARFEAYPSLVSAPFTADAATPRLSLRLESEQGVALFEESRSVAPGNFTRWAVDLAPHSGSTVHLTLESSALGAAPLFLGSPTVWGEPPAPPRRFVVVGLDTTRPHHLGAWGDPQGPGTPHLDRFTRTAALFTHAWTPAPRTRPSFRAAATGRRALEAVGAPNVAEVFHRAGFRTAGLAANIHLHTRFGFHRGFELWHHDPLAGAPDQVRRAEDWLRQAPRRPSFLFLHLMDPHLDYSPPAPWSQLVGSRADPPLPRRFSRSDVYRWMRTGELTPSRRRRIQSLYRTELAFTDHHLGRLFRTLGGQEGESLVVVHSDHGEEFWEHGSFRAQPLPVRRGDPRGACRSSLWLGLGPLLDARHSHRHRPHPLRLRRVGRRPPRPTAGASDPPSRVSRHRLAPSPWAISATDASGGGSSPTDTSTSFTPDPDASACTTSTPTPASRSTSPLGGTSAGSVARSPWLTSSTSHPAGGFGFGSPNR